MDFTPEQQAIVESRGNLKINAVAGSGKTTVLVEYARRQPKNKKILYLAFNRSVKLEALRRFEKSGLTNVDVQTAHSLAFRRIVTFGGYRVSKGYKSHEIAQLLGITAQGHDVHIPYIIANHIQKFAACFCNSTQSKVQQLDYASVLTHENATDTVKRFYNQIEHGTRQFLAKMDRKEIDITHDFYLKKFQLSKPSLNSDIILFDEGQDASPVMLDVFLSQPSQKVIVGDVHQQIYGWRYAINALRQVDFASLSLSTSFRFNQHIADLAMESLSWKSLLGDSTETTITGLGGAKKIASRAVVSRTNLALLKSAIDAMEYDRSVKKIYFEGNINSYTYAADGASIYDVLNLYLDKRDRIRDLLIKTMPDFEALTDYAEKSEDPELLMIIDIVDEYGKEIPFLLKKLTAMHVPDDDRDKADMIFSTLHRCKGMEYDHVTLTEDFINKDRLGKLIKSEPEATLDKAKLNEEINLTYVAVTRSKNFLSYPEEMFPNVDQALFCLPKPPKKNKYLPIPKKAFWSHSPVDEYNVNSGKKWKKAEEKKMVTMFNEGASVERIAEKLGRSTGGIQSRLEKMGVAFFTF